VRGLIAAFVAGLLIGIERGWRLRESPDGSRVAGLRTFTLLGIAGGLIALIVQALGQLVGAVPLVGLIAVLAVGYARSARTNNQVDATTVVAAIMAVALGLLAGAGQAALAIAGAAATTVILATRDRSHRFLARLGRRDVNAMAYYAVIAGGVLPFMPNVRMGPYQAWNPFQLWLVVVLVTGFSFASYIANRLIGERKGTLATAMIGGAYSSTAVTASLAERIRGGQQGPLTAGVAIATAVMFVRILVLVGFLAPSVLWPLLQVIGPAMLTAWVVSLLLWRRSSGESENGHGEAARNPITLLPALGFVLAVAGAAVLVRWAQATFGETGVAWSLFVAGSFDVDAAIITLSILPADAIPSLVASVAIGGTVAVNMVFKMAIAGATARRQGLPAVMALGVSLLVLLASLGWVLGVILE
jgi:uncharacterized membrane protein (DUF4010 family)